MKKRRAIRGRRIHPIDSGGAEEFTIVSAEEGRVIRIFTIAETLRIVPKERFHLVGGCERDEQSAGSIANNGPGVRHSPRCEKRIPGFQLETVRHPISAMYSPSMT